MAINLTGQVAMISGGLGDIGRATGEALAEAGAAVAVSDMADQPKGEAWCDSMATLGRRCRYDRVDVTDSQAVHRWVDRVEQALGPPTLAVVNAAVVEPADSLTIDSASWGRQLAVNLDGAFYMAQAAAKRLVAAKRPGGIVFVGSWAAHRPHPDIVAYSVAKAGLRMLMQCMALELAPHGIRVNEIAPGYVDAGLSGRLFKQEPAKRQRAVRQTPTGQLIDATEVARQIVWLCDSANRHLTGHALVMDGGLSLVSSATGNTATKPETQE
ncbi:SDR family NAD(P)-dependent oxidoreductase [Phycisphaerales bacterium AB-hyl4]|uniref:SDR family NAD(P)-dependent oxidoreductase n=1 Tax=Natronomicrosphaera hydrolytica TaxID=3242702 RepID=A0ABV4U1M8_9BACT